MPLIVVPVPAGGKRCVEVPVYKGPVIMKETLHHHTTPHLQYHPCPSPPSLSISPPPPSYPIPRRFFNTNNLWVNLQLRDTLAASGGALNLPLIKNVKTVNPRDSKSAKVGAGRP